MVTLLIHNDMLQQLAEPLGRICLDLGQALLVAFDDHFGLGHVLKLTTKAVIIWSQSRSREVKWRLTSQLDCKPESQHCLPYSVLSILASKHLRKSCPSVQ